MTFAPVLTGATSLYYSGPFATTGTWNITPSGGQAVTLLGGGTINAAGGAVAASPQTVSLGGGINIDISGAGQTVVIGGSGNSSLQLNFNNVSRQIDVASGDTLQVVNSIVGATNGFTKGDTGTLRLSGADSNVDGAVNINAGTLRLDNANALGGGAADPDKKATIALAAGTTLQLRNNAATAFNYPVIVSGNAAINVDRENTNSNLAHSLGTIGWNAAILTVSGANGFDLASGEATVAAALTGAVMLNTNTTSTDWTAAAINSSSVANRTFAKQGTGGWFITGAGTNFVGGTTLNVTAGLTQLDHVSALGGNGNTYVLSGSVNTNSTSAGVLKITAASAANAGDTFQVTKNGLLGGSTTFLNSLVVGPAGNVTTFAVEGGIIQNAAGEGDAFVAANAANLDLTVPNYWLGFTGAAFTGNQSVGTGTAWRGLSADGRSAGWTIGNITANGDFVIRATNGHSMNLGNGTAGGNFNILAANPVTVTLAGATTLNTGGAAGVSNFQNVTLRATSSLTISQNFSQGGAGGTTPGNLQIASGGSVNTSGSLPNAYNGNVEVQSGGTITFDDAGGITGAGTITTRAGSFVNISGTNQAISGTQPLVIDAGTILRISLDNIPNFDARLGNGAVYRMGGGDRMLPNFTLDSADDKSGMITNDGSTRTITNAQTVTLGSGGGIIAATTGTTLTFNNLNVTGPTRNLSFGTGSTIDGNAKAGNVVLNSAAANTINVASIDLVTGTLNAFSNGMTVNVGPGGTGFFEVYSATTFTSSNDVLLNAALNVQFTGTARLNGGPLNIPSVGSIEGNGRIIVGSPSVNNSTALFTVGGNNLSTVFNGVLSNADSGVNNRRAKLLKVGTGVLTLAGANTYGRAGELSTTIRNGALIVDTADVSGAGEGDVLIGDGTPATAPALGGIGLISGNVTMAGNATLGTNLGTDALTVGSLNMAAGATYSWELVTLSTDSPGNNFDIVTVNTGNLVLGGTSKFTLDFNFLSGTDPDSADPFWSTTHTWKVLDITDTAANPGNSTFSSITNATWTSGFFNTSVGSGGDAGDILLNFIPGLGGPPIWQGVAGANWTSSASWVTGVVPNGATAEAQFKNAAGAGSPANLDASQAINKLTFDSTSNYTLSGPTANVLSLAGTNPTINVAATNSGTQTINTSLNLGNNATINVDGGTLAFALPVGATSAVGTNVTATIGAGDTLQLGGAVSALGNAAGNKAKITTSAVSSTLIVTGTGQTVGRVTGPTTVPASNGEVLGQTMLAASSDLTVGGLRQNSLALAAGTLAVPTKLTAAAQGGSAGLVVLNNTAANGGSGTPGLTLANNSILDVVDNDLVLYYAGAGGDPNPTATIQAYIDNYYAAATNVPVIASQGIINTGGETVFVAFDNALTGFGDGAVGGTFYDLTLGDTGLGTGFNQTIVRYTWGGDYDLNGVVDALDYAIVDANLGQAVGSGGVAGWQRGDGDFDGMVTPLDYSPIDANLGKGGPLGGIGGGTLNAIPEPSMWVIGSLAAVGLGALRYRRRNL